MRTNGKKATRQCPCGHLGDPASSCRCTPERIASYRARISGPLLDRIDLHVEMPRVPPESIAAAQRAEDSRSIAGRVHAARLLQLQRQGRSNARIEGADVLALSRADDCALEFLGRAMRGLALSARAYHRVLRVARTIADLAGSDEVRTVHVSEAVQLRQLDRRSPSMGATSISR